MASISSFKANLSGGGARANQFRVDLTFPPFVGGQAGAAGNAAQYLCKSATLPGSILEDTAVFYRGRPVHFAGERSFQPWTVTMYNDTNFLLRNVMERWSNGITSYTSTNGILRSSDYQVDLQVHQLDRNDNTIKTYVLFDAWPQDVGQIALDFEANNQIETFDVTFLFNFFTTDGI